MAKVFNQDIAQAMCEDYTIASDLIYARDVQTFYMKEDSTSNFYKQLDEDAMIDMVAKHVTEKYADQNFTTQTYLDIVNQIRIFIKRKYPTIPYNFTALNDCLLDTNTFTLLPFDPQKIALHQIPIHSNEMEKPTPNFNAFLRSSIVTKELDTASQKFIYAHDEGLTTLVQEMFGYYLMPSLKAQAVFFLVGKGSNGKSKMLEVIENLIGQEFTTAMSIQYLTNDKFATSGLIGKRLNVCNEEESKYIKSDKFKGLVTGDTTQAEYKFGRSFAFKPTTKYVFASNEFPTFDGINEGLKRRIKIIPFNRVFKNTEQDKDLSEKLKAEMGGILRWAIQGAIRLQENNYNFSEPAQYIKATQDFVEGVSSSVKFFNETYVIGGEFKLSWEEMYRKYRDWCELQGRKSVNLVNFKKDLRGQITSFEEYECVFRENGIVARGVHISYVSQEEAPVQFAEETTTLTEYLTEQNDT